ncbi:hypothetical protein CC78DRAFT_611968 [Lojkania enalia]|uniref:DUF2428 domain-containing protein n=1 Tax=Lojkania enalia TaxID=147567 RepID=A0A9P4NBS4_9PLEO|nr:hypothetical protein CC78DRAFT_611968 [Didymosphaeria enalia]
MATNFHFFAIPVSERTLRDLPKELSLVIPDFAGEEEIQAVKKLQDVVAPLLDTADVADLPSSHRAAACNALCAIIEHCVNSKVRYAQEAILDDSIWYRLFQIYLQRSDNAKGKSMRQMLLVLTGVLVRNQSQRSLELRDRAISTFVELICLRQGRMKVKPALQGLAHFLLKNVVSIPEFVGLYQSSIGKPRFTSSKEDEPIQSLFKTLLGWVIHHDTALPAGHAIKNFLGQYRRQLLENKSSTSISASWTWIKPVVDTLRLWPDRTQQFKTHVFPHCFCPNIVEYLHFLSYLHFSEHMDVRGELPDQLLVYNDKKNGLDNFEEFRILLAAIQTGKELGIIRDTDHCHCESIKVQGNILSLPDDIFKDWLSHPKPEVRIAGLFLSIYSTAVTRPITTGIISSLKRNLIQLYTDTDANFRREVLVHTQRLFDRLRGSTATLMKLAHSSTGREIHRIPFPTGISRYGRRTRTHTDHDPLLETLDFIRWYVHFLEWELRSTASYQRRITALRALTIIIRSGVDPSIQYHHLSKSAQGQLQWAHELQLSNTRLIRILMDLLLDPFDDIRSASASILEICMDSLSDSKKKTTLLCLRTYIRRAESAMLRTGRADQADGVARAYSLLFSQRAHNPMNPSNQGSGGSQGISIVMHLINQLEETIEMANKNLSVAVNGRPVHGIFSALRYIVNQEQFYTEIALSNQQERGQWKLIHDRICTCFESLWSCIRDVLCADAPEGHIPEELEEDMSIDTKEILSYSWRGLKEASVLLRTIVSKAPIGPSEPSMLTPLVFEKLGTQCFTQLVELRHRGAFLTVAQTFAAFCQRSLSVDDQTLRGLSKNWYQETLLCIQDKATAITRRSAGIPSLMVGLIAADIPSGQLFRRAMRDLIAEASLDAQDLNIEESRLPQVHALNCLKEIFTSSKLSFASEAYIGEGLDLAARTLNSKIWPIRNCGLMLFKALIERLLGSDEAQGWKENERGNVSRFSYNNYPSLVGILANLLDPNGPLEKSMAIPSDGNSIMNLHGAEGVFPALQILRQAPPPEANRAAITKSVFHLLSSPHWHLRDMAARTLVSLHNPNELLKAIVSLLSDTQQPHNSRHGILLAVKYMVKKLIRCSANPAEHLDVLLGPLSSILSSGYIQDTCSFTRSAFVDIVTICGLSILRIKDISPITLQVWFGLANLLIFTPSTASSCITGDALLQISLSRCSLSDYLASSKKDPSTEAPASKMLLLQDIFFDLAHKGPDTCSAVLDSLGDIVRDGQLSPLVIRKSLLMFHIYEIIRNTADEEVRWKAQSILADSLSDQSMKDEFLRSLNQDDVMQSIDELQAQCLEGPPSNMQSALRLLGSFLDFAFHSYYDQNKIIIECIARYIRLLRMTIIETNPFDARFAAAQSMSTFNYLWTTPKTFTQTAPLILGFSLILYDLLNDDDDEIRDLSALTTANFLRGQKPQAGIKNTVPILAAHHLAGYLIQEFRDSTYLFKEAVERLAGSTPPLQATLFAQPFNVTLAEARKEDTALFVQEKQNLFKDDTLDIMLWTHILKSLSPRAVSAQVISQITNWVLDALYVLTITAKSEIDGALGWMSKVEVFTLILRVICAAGVIVSFNKVDANKIRKALREFADAAVESQGHNLLIERAERVLEDSVIEVLTIVHEGLPRL